MIEQVTKSFERVGVSSERVSKSFERVDLFTERMTMPFERVQFFWNGLQMDVNGIPFKNWKSLVYVFPCRVTITIAISTSIYCNHDNIYPYITVRMWLSLVKLIISISNM